MACPQFGGFLMGCLGWLCILVAVSTNNWVIMCKYGMNACKKSEESKIKGPWAECSVSAAHYECQPLTQILELPAYIHTTRALMITASTLAVLAVVLLLMSLPCISMGSEPTSVKNRRAMLGGVCFVFVGLCATVSTVWFPIGVHGEQDLRSFGYSLYVGWVGSVLALLGGLLIVCCSFSSSSSSSHGNGHAHGNAYHHNHQNHHNSDRFYYSKQGAEQLAPPPPASSAGGGGGGATATSHAKTAHV